MSSSPFSSSSSSSRPRKPVLFLPSLRAKLVASFHAYKNSTPSRRSNGMTRFRGSSLQRMAPGFHSYDKLENPSDDDEEDPPPPSSSELHSNENENENARLKSSTDGSSSSSSSSNRIPRSNNKQRFMRRFRKSSRRRRRRRFHVLSSCKLKWLLSPLWLLKKLIRLYGSFFYMDSSSQAPMLLMGMHLSVPPSPLPLPIT